jgi:hypothetical protein
VNGTISELVDENYTIIPNDTSVTIYHDDESDEYVVNVTVVVEEPVTNETTEEQETETVSIPLDDIIENNPETIIVGEEDGNGDGVNGAVGNGNVTDGDDEIIFDEGEVLSSAWSCFESCSMTCDTTACRDSCTSDCEQDSDYTYMVYCDNCLENAELVINTYYSSGSSEETRRQECYQWYLCLVPESPVAGMSIEEYNTYKNEIKYCGRYFIQEYCPDILAIISPEAVCTPDWTCTAWSECVDGVQTRECVDMNNCNQVEGAPIMTTSCGCTPWWECTPWSECSGGTQTRECIDRMNCTSPSYVPEISRTC